VYFSVAPSTVRRRWINDLHPGLIAVYQALHDRPQQFIELCRSIEPARPGEKRTAPGPRGTARHPERLKAVFDAIRLDETCDQAFRYFYINRTVFGGRVNYAVPSRLYFSNPAGWNIVGGHRLEEAAGHVRGTKITCGDYARLFTAPGDGVWIYADPPYVVNNAMTPTSQLYQHVFAMEDHERLAEVVRACPHHVALSYDDDPDGFVRSLYPPSEGFRVVENNWRYCGSTRQHKVNGKELLILKDHAPAKASLLCG
jgi:site-specific DNA-adenine methylase